MKVVVYTRTRFCRRTRSEITNTVTFDNAKAHPKPLQEHIELAAPEQEKRDG